MTAGERRAWLGNGLRQLMGQPQRWCRLKRISPTVQCVEYTPQPVPGRPLADPRLSIEGVYTCKSRCCAFCAPKWQRTRAAEITQAISNHGPEKCLFASFTLRHHRGMPLPILVRLVRRAFGDLFSGRAGAAFARKLGGKPVATVRAIEGTWSHEGGWHPHIHAIVFCQEEIGYRVGLEHAFFERWCEAINTALLSFSAFVDRIVDGRKKPCRYKYQVYTTQLASGEWVERRRQVGSACPICAENATRPEGTPPIECPNLRERAERLFGKQLVRKRETLLEAMARIGGMLGAFYKTTRATFDGDCYSLAPVPTVEPDPRYGVDVQRVRSQKGLDRYLSKLGAMGLELACGTSKLGRQGKNGIWHYSLWEAGRLACEGNAAAGAAFSEWYWSTLGTQGITFSDREALGLAPDDYADGQEPIEQATTETKRHLGDLPAAVWDAAVRRYGHAWVLELYRLYAAGKLAELADFIPASWGNSQPLATGPPRAPPPLEWWHRLEAETRAEERGAGFMATVNARLRAEHDHEQRAEREKGNVAFLEGERRKARLRDRLIASNASGRFSTPEMRAALKEDEPPESTVVRASLRDRVAEARQASAGDPDESFSEWLRARVLARQGPERQGSA
jgi:hypothetical protein